MNPLLSLSPLKNHAIDFAALKPQHFTEAMDIALKRGQERLTELKRHPASFDNTLRGLEAVAEDVEFIFNAVGNLVGAHASDELQSIIAELGPKVAAFSNDILLDPEVFAQIEEVYRQRHSLALSPTQIRFVEKVRQDFAHNGAALNDENKARLRAIDQRLAEINPRFRENVLKATNAFELWVDREEDLAGMPDSLKEAARQSAAEKGQPHRWRFTLHEPMLVPLLRTADARDLRRKMVEASQARGMSATWDNRPLVLEFVRLMHEKAQLLGYPSYAAYILKQRMAESPDQVRLFLRKLSSAAKPVALKEIAEMKELSGLDRLEAWDISYYAEKVRQKRYALNQDELRPYFKLENVLDGAFTLAHKLFNLRFVKSDEYPVYHPEVQVYEVFKERGEELEFKGLFYTDFFPRESKSQGAWMTNFFEQGTFRGQRMRPHVSIVCNFTRPSQDRPSLLSYDEVRTLFHEFGHALHGLLSDVEFRKVAGTNVFLDFVELPSQFLENWTEHSDGLMLFARHFQTGEPIPAALIEKLKESQKFLVGYSTMRQVNFATLDLAWYAEPPLDPGADVVAFEETATRETTVLPRVSGGCISTSFLHIFGGGYASGYYSYKWAEALDADAFELFREKGLFDRSAAERFEEFILSKGGSDHPMRLYEDFRGRGPDPEALLRRDGLL